MLNYDVRYCQNLYLKLLKYLRYVTLNRAMVPVTPVAHLSLEVDRRSKRENSRL